MSRYSDLDCKVYVGDLPNDATEREVEKAFSGYGPLKSVWVARNPAGFAFVEFDESRDAEDAVRALDGSSICGCRARVEFATGKSKPKSWDMPRSSHRSDYRSDYRNDYRDDFRRGRNDGGGRRPFNPDDKCYECGLRGHYAYDCEVRLRKQRRTRRSRSRSNRRGSRSYSRRHSKSRSRSRSRSKDSRSKSRSRSRSRSRSASPRESRSRDRSDSRK